MECTCRPMKRTDQTSRHFGQRVVVAIPAKNEADWIGRCLDALAQQTRQADAVLLLLNNCTDGIAGIAHAYAAVARFPLLVECRTLPTSTASAGHARRLATELAAQRAGPDGILLTTDADTIVPGDWIERNLSALAAGADLVCGRVVIDPVEAALIPAHLHADDAVECALTEMLDRIAAQLDPDPADPWPRHTEAAGASLAVTIAAFNRVGGFPPRPSGEDRAFVCALARLDGRIRHDPEVVVSVSGRIHGRAHGGMADTIRRRMQQQDEYADVTVEPAADAYRRIDFRRRVRLAWRETVPGEALAADLGIPEPQLRALLNTRTFGAAWADIEARSPFLIRRRVRFTELPRQIGYARQLLEHLSVPDATQP